MNLLVIGAGNYNKGDEITGLPTEETPEGTATFASRYHHPALQLHLSNLHF